MAFWIFLTLCNLMIPIIMVVIGNIFVKNPPKKINGVYGYRTTRSRRSQEAWDYAHLYCGKLWRKIGTIMLPISILGMIPFTGKSEDTMGWGSLLIITIQCVILLGAIYPVEQELKRKFEKSEN